MSTVATRVGKFVWHEQVSDNPQGAEGFYKQLFGWGTEVFKPGEIDYTAISSGGTTHGGFSQAMEGAPPPHWLGHIQVENLDETIEKAKKEGDRARRRSDRRADGRPHRGSLRHPQGSARRGLRNYQGRAELAAESTRQ